MQTSWQMSWNGGASGWGPCLIQSQGLAVSPGVPSASPALSRTVPSGPCAESLSLSLCISVGASQPRHTPHSCDISYRYGWGLQSYGGIILLTNATQMDYFFYSSNVLNSMNSYKLALRGEM